MEKWFRRLADVPGVGYQGSPGIDRTRLPEHDAVPEISSYEFEGKRRQSMWWKTKEGGTTASPAHRWETKPKKGESPADTALRKLRETAELPGTLSDYHFAIQHCHDELRSYAGEARWVLEEVERLCWLDIRLIEKYPETITSEYEGERTFYSVSAFYRLIDLYEKEGYLYEALEVAKLAEKFEQRGEQVAELRERIDLLEAEEHVA